MSARHSRLIHLSMSKRLTYPPRAASAPAQSADKVVRPRLRGVWASTGTPSGEEGAPGLLCTLTASSKLDRPCKCGGDALRACSSTMQCLLLIDATDTHIVASQLHPADWVPAIHPALSHCCQRPPAALRACMIATQSWPDTMCRTYLVRPLIQKPHQAQIKTEVDFAPAGPNESAHSRKVHLHRDSSQAQYEQAMPSNSCAPAILSQQK
jgi:hypothetical protein